MDEDEIDEGIEDEDAEEDEDEEEEEGPGRNYYSFLLPSGSGKLGGCGHEYLSFNQILVLPILFSPHQCATAHSGVRTGSGAGKGGAIVGGTSGRPSPGGALRGGRIDGSSGAADGAAGSSGSEEEDEEEEEEEEDGYFPHQMLGTGDEGLSQVMRCLMSQTYKGDA